MTDSKLVEELQDEVDRLKKECELWRKTVSQLTQTINKMLLTFIIQK